MTQRVRVKICGLTRQVDVTTAVAAGADALGFVFYAGSKRCVSLQQAIALRHKIPAFVTTVALFVNAPPEEVRRVMTALNPDLLQFHGDEPPAYCAMFQRRYLKAFRVGAPGLETATQLADACMAYADATAWLFDAYHANYGGSGTRFSLDLLTQVQNLAQRQALILAGGLTPANVGAALEQITPYAVDVSSGVEAAPGVKSPEKIAQFIQAVQRVQ